MADEPQNDETPQPVDALNGTGVSGDAPSGNGTDSDQSAARRQLPKWLVGLLLLLSTLVSTGVTMWMFELGPWRPPVAPPSKEEVLAKQKKQPQKPKRDFDRFRLVVKPGDPTQVAQAVKPGHWQSVQVTTKANNFDFSGQLDTAAAEPEGRPLALDHTPYRFVTSRPIVLPKGQAKNFDVLMYTPRGQTKTWVADTLLSGFGGGEVTREMELFQHMPSYQYFMLVLAREPERYRFLKVIDSVRPPWSEMVADNAADYYYRVLSPKIGSEAPFATTSLTLTSLAFVFWDDVDPQIFRPEQQQALLDWLHWGGQLIISGPLSLDSLRGSFLDEYLPAKSDGTLSIDTSVMGEMVGKWSLLERGQIKPLEIQRPWNGVKLKLSEQGSFMPDAESLVAERRVGRGRVVVTAFRLPQRELLNWHGFDGFFNACLLRRPPRQFKAGDIGQVKVLWADDALDRHDPRLNSSVRYFARDTQTARAFELADLRPAEKQAEDATLYSEMENFVEGQNLTIELQHSGVGGWNDFGPAPEAAREALKEAAGITVPQRSFVIWVLGTYLVVLVPLNGIIFWLLGRLEYAWVAAPIISLVFAGVVVKLARLDIGFARSTTEISIVELYAGHSRAHVTRYTALYTSLSTKYDVHFADAGSLAQPFVADAEYSRLGEDPSVVSLRRQNDVQLSGFEVASNSTGMIHSEQMQDLGGAIKFTQQAGEQRVSNGTTIALRGAAVVRRKPLGIFDAQAARLGNWLTGKTSDGSSSLEVAWLGDLPPGEELPLKFDDAGDSPYLHERDRATATSSEAEQNTVNIRRLTDLAEDLRYLDDGELRLVAWIEAPLSGVRIEPAASQARHAGLVVVHLKPADLPEPQQDKNTRYDISLTPPRDPEAELQNQLNPEKPDAP